MKIAPIVLLALTCGSASSFSQDSNASRPLAAKRLSVAPTIDGDLSELVWKEAAKAEGFFDPFTGAAAQDATEVWMGYDDKAIYLAYYCHDSHPEQIVGREIRSGVEFTGEDYIVFRLDPFFTRQDGQIDRFLVNAIGTKTEMISAGRGAKREWRGEWDAAVKRLPDGWSAEIRIPWKMLSYPNPPAQGLRMSVNFGRYYGRGKNRELWSNITSVFRANLDGIWEGVLPPKRSAPRPQYLAYGLVEAAEGGRRPSLDAGLDVRYPITPQMTAVGSINPDFKNIEQTVESIQFSRAERFLGDSRPFFAEGAAFSGTTNPAGIGRIFYSRRIEDFDVGGKLFGKVNPNLSVGGLATIDFDGARAGVFQVRQQFGATARVTGFGVVSEGSSRDDSTVGGTALKRLGNFWLYGEVARQSQAGLTSQAQSYTVTYLVPTLTIDGTFTELPRSFNPSLGLIDFRNRKGWNVSADYANSYSNKWAKEVYGHVLVDDHRRHDTGDRFIDGYDAFATIITRTQQELTAGYERRRFFGERDELTTLIYRLGSSNRFNRTSTGYVFGSRGVDPYRFMFVSTTRRVVGNLDVGLSWNSEEFRGHTDQYIATVGWEFDAQRSVTGRYVSSPLGTNWYLAYRNGGASGTELYVIFGDPNALSFQQRLTVKLVWPF